MLLLQSARSLRIAVAAYERTKRGCLPRIPPLIKIPHPGLNIKGRRRGSSRGIYPRIGNPSRRPHLCCGSTENVRLSFHVSPPILIASNYYSGFGEERPLVRYHLSLSPPRNLHRQLALQSSKTSWSCRQPGKPPSPISTSVLRTPRNKTSATLLLPFLHSSQPVPTDIAISFATFIRRTITANINPATKR